MVIGLEAMNSPMKKEPSKGGWKSAIFIIFVEMAERFSYYGISGNLFVYLTKVLGLATPTAAKSVNNWIGAAAIFPLIGGFLADSYVGRFKMIIISTAIYLTGLIVLTIAVSAVPHHSRRSVFFLALYILSVGEGGHKPCVQTFAADQFDEGDPDEKAAKSSFFNWWYVGIVFGATTAILVVVYIEDSISWSVGYGILTSTVAAALIVFLIGSCEYRHQVPVGSPFTRLAQVAVAAFTKRQLSVDGGSGICNEADAGAGARPLTRTAKFRFLDKASIIAAGEESGQNRNPWRLCPANQVEETKLVLQLIPVWLSCLMFTVVIAQLGTYFTKQVSTLRRGLTTSVQVPAASFQVFTGITILVSMLLYERMFVPLTRRLTGHRSGITMLQRIGTGLVISTVAMIVAALLESKRVYVAREHNLINKPNAVIPMAAWWLLPQYVMIGLGDVFTVVGLQELFYEQMPVGMRSVGAAAYITLTGMGNLVSSALISVVQEISRRRGEGWLGNNINTAKLENFYWVLAVMSGMNLCVFVWVASRFVYKRVEEGGKEVLGTEV